MKYLISILFSLICFSAFSQTIQIRSNGVATIEDVRLMAGKNMFIPIYADTNQANNGSNLGIDSSGAIIYTRNPYGMWYRQNRQWIKFAPAASSSPGGGQYSMQLNYNGAFYGDDLFTYNVITGNITTNNIGEVYLYPEGHVHINSLNEPIGFSNLWLEGLTPSTAPRQGYLLAVNDTGEVVKAAASGAAGTFLQNDGNNNLSWTAIGGSGTFTGIDSVTIFPPPPSPTTNVCYWKQGVQTCYSIIGNGVDSAKVLNDTLFVYAAGDSVAYPVTGNQIFYGDTVTVSGNTLCSTNQGNDTCILINNGGQFVDSIWINSDSSAYVYGTKNGTQLGTFSTLQKVIQPEVGSSITVTQSNDTIYIGGGSGAQTWQELLDYSASLNPNGNILGNLPNTSSNGYFSLETVVSGDKNGLYVFGDGHPLVKGALLGSYDSTIQSINWGFFSQAASNYIYGINFNIATTDTAGFLITAPLINTELGNDSVLVISTTGQVKKRGISGGGSTPLFNAAGGTETATGQVIGDLNGNELDIIDGIGNKVQQFDNRWIYYNWNTDNNMVDLDAGSNFITLRAATSYFDGNVGIGTNIPARNLDINGSFRANTGAGSLIDAKDNGAIDIQSADGDLTLASSGSTDIVFNSSRDNVFSPVGNTLITTGNVGIGTASPTEKLHTVGSFLAETTDGAKLLLQSNGSVEISSYDNSVTISTQVSGDIVLSPNAGGNTLVSAGDVEVSGVTNNTFKWAAASGTPTNTATPAGWVKINIGGADAWLPYYQ